jgi:hypothetical protein
MGVGTSPAPESLKVAVAQISLEWRNKMKKLSVSLASAVAMLFLVVGCSDEQAVNPTGNSLSGSGAGGIGKGRVVESVTGSGHLTRPETVGNPGLWRTFSFNARKYDDGSVEGSYQVSDHEWTYAKGPITCFMIVDNQAWLYGVIEKSGLPGYVGTQRVFRVIDNGEGANAAPDQISLLHLALNPCPEEPPLGRPAVYDIESGNIQIRP